MKTLPTSWKRALIWANSLLLAACTGMTFGENDAGEDTFLDGARYQGVEETTEEGVTICRILGSIAVDPVTETAYVLQTTYPGSCSGLPGGTPQKRLVAVHPDTGQTRVVLDLTGGRDLRMLFPQGRLLVMAERGGADELTLLDPQTLDILATRKTAARYHGTRLSPSRRYVAVADNTRDPAPIHLIDTLTLRIVEISHEGEWLEAMWLENSDTLSAAIFTHGAGGEPPPDPRGWPDAPAVDDGVRIALWHVDEAMFEAAANGSSGPDGLWAEPDLDVPVPGARMDFWFSFTWIGVSPDDRHLVVPVVFADEPQSREHRLLVLDTLTGAVREVADARGPVGFTPDGASIVSYRYVRVDGDSDADPQRTAPALLILDALSLEEEVLPLPEVNGGPSFFVTHAGNFVLVGASFGGGDLVLFDLDNDRQTRMEGLDVDLWEFVSRTAAAELWLVDEGLFVLDVVGAAWAEVGLGFIPDHVNILPRRDLLVIDDPEGHRLVFFDPENREIVRAVDLPEPAVDEQPQVGAGGEPPYDHRG